MQNLNEKVPIDELKDTLYNTFEEYGEIIDVIIVLDTDHRQKKYTHEGTSFRYLQRHQLRHGGQEKASRQIIVRKNIGIFLIYKRKSISPNKSQT